MTLKKKLIELAQPLEALNVAGDTGKVHLARASEIMRSWNSICADNTDAPF